jgi:hypothetical protein
VIRIRGRSLLRYWVDQLVRLYTEYRQDTFIFWGGGDVGQQIETFAKEVVPAVRERVGVIVS